jgi:hypothetical protein
MKAGAILAAVQIALLCAGDLLAQPSKDQSWVDTQRILLQREWALQTNRINDLNQAAQKGLETSVDRVLGWVKDNLAAGDPKALLLGGDTTLPLLLVQQNLDMYKEGIRGDWSAYGTKLAETLWTKITDLLPEKLHPSVLDPTIFEQLFDLKTLADLKQKAQTIDAIQERLAKMQTLIDSAQKELDAAKADGTPAILESDDQIVKDIDDWLANYPISLKPLPETPDGTDITGTDLDKALNENMTKEMGADNTHLPDLLIHPLNYTCKSGPCTLDEWITENNQSRSDDWTRLQNAFQGLAQIANAFDPPHRSPITPELLAAMDAWVKGLAQLQAQMFQALAAVGNSAACRTVAPSGKPAIDGFDNDDPVHYFHWANIGECNRLYAVFTGYRNAFMGSTPPPVKAAGAGTNSAPNPSPPQGKGSSGATTTTSASGTQANNSTSTSPNVPATNTQSPTRARITTPTSTGAASPASPASPRGATRSGGVDFSGPQSYVTNHDLNDQVDQLMKLIQETEQVKSKVRDSLLRLDPTLVSRMSPTGVPNVSPKGNGAITNKSSSVPVARGTAVGTPSQATRPPARVAPSAGVPNTGSPQGMVPKGGIDFSGEQTYKANPHLDSEVDKLLKQAEPDQPKQKQKK